MDAASGRLAGLPFPCVPVLRRVSTLFLLLAAWLPALAGAAVDTRGIPSVTTPSFTVHSLGLSQPAHTSQAQAAHEAPVPIEGGPSHGAAPAARHGGRPGYSSLAAAAPHAANLRRLEWVLRHDRARTGFLTSSSSNAPPHVHG